MSGESKKVKSEPEQGKREKESVWSGGEESLAL